jgi:hypothetical protein
MNFIFAKRPRLPCKSLPRSCRPFVPYVETYTDHTPNDPMHGERRSPDLLSDRICTHHDIIYIFRSRAMKPHLSFHHNISNVDAELMHVASWAKTSTFKRAMSALLVVAIGQCLTPPPIFSVIARPVIQDRGFIHQGERQRISIYISFTPGI